MDVKDRRESTEGDEMLLSDATRVTDSVYRVQNRFPEPIQVDGIHVVDELDGYYAKAVETTRAGIKTRFIVTEIGLIHSEEWLLDAIMAHEMTHIYFYQNGYPNVTDSDPLFEWVCGRVLAVQDKFNHNGHRFKELAVPFLKDADAYPDV